MCRQIRRAAGEAADVEVARHALPVVHRIIVPQERAPPDLLRDLGKMTGRQLEAADLGAGPHHVDGGVEPLPEFVQVIVRAPAEHLVQDRIVRIISGAADQPGRAGAARRKLDDRRLPLRQLGNVAAHIVEQDGKVVRLQLIELLELARQHLLPILLGVQVDLERAESDPEAHAQRPALLRQLAQLLHLRVGMEGPATRGEDRRRPWARRDRSGSRAGAGSECFRCALPKTRGGRKNPR
jgi:hypothetical protein